MQTNAGKSKHILADDDLIKDSQYWYLLYEYLVWKQNEYTRTEQNMKRNYFVRR